MASTLARAAFAAALLASFALAGCASSSPADTPVESPVETPVDEAPSYGDSSPGAEDATSGAAVLMVADSTLGEIVVDGEGMTVYMFDSDTQGSGVSTCEGQCLANWPPVTADAESLDVEGVTGEIGTITGTDGGTQLTLDGWPLYYFAGDAAPGDVSGQGVNDVWWVLSPAGERITG